MENMKGMTSTSSSIYYRWKHKVIYSHYAEDGADIPRAKEYWI